jgi:hypothetical protein
MLDLCESAGFLNALRIIFFVIDIVKIAVPLLLIIMMSFDVYGLITDPNNTKKVIDVVKKRLMAALLVFFIPTLIEVTLTMLGDRVPVSECYNNANSGYINAIKDKANSSN